MKFRMGSFPGSEGQVLRPVGQPNAAEASAAVGAAGEHRQEGDVCELSETLYVVAVK